MDLLNKQISNKQMSIIEDKPDTITLYYNFRDRYDLNISIDKSNILTFKNNYYAGVSNLYMTDETGRKKDDVISFVSNHVKSSNYQEIPYIPDVFVSKITIRTNYSILDSIDYEFICANGMYCNFNEDYSSTHLPVVTYYISVATGKFSEYKTLTIYYNNDSTRIIKINK
jgi:hypothetical protein